MRGENSSVYKNIHLVIYRDDVIKGVTKLRKQWRIPPKGFSDISAYNNWFAWTIRTGQYPDFLDDINSLRTRYKLPIKWTPFLASYTLKNKHIPPSPLRSGRSIRTPLVSYQKPKSISDPYQIQILITSETRQVDITKIWKKQITPLQKSLPDHDRSRTRTKLDRDLGVYKLNKKGISPYKAYNQRMIETNEETNQESIVKAHQRIKDILKK